MEKAKYIISIGVIILIVGLIFFYWKKPKPEEKNESDSAKNLGSEIYGNISNPVQDALPETVAPIPNPIKGTYKNPFE